jgi:hypothetical protein
MSKNMAVVDDNGIVVNIIVCDDNEEETSNLISYTDDNPAWVSGDRVDGFFYAPQPYVSWIRDNGKWVSPVPMPQDGKAYWWDEDNQMWHLAATGSSDEIATVLP